jgi:hypothetical protein
MTPRAPHHRATVALLVLTLAWAVPRSAAAQGGDFAAAITGAASATIRGFAPSTGRTGVTWSLQMETPGGDNVIMVYREGAGRPAPGTYGLVDFTTKARRPRSGDLVASVHLHDSILPGSRGFDTVQGTLTVTASSDASVEGEFSLTAHHSSSPALGVTVTGTFTSHDKSE